MQLLKRNNNKFHLILLLKQNLAFFKDLHAQLWSNIEIFMIYIFSLNKTHFLFSMIS